MSNFRPPKESRQADPAHVPQSPTSTFDCINGFLQPMMEMANQLVPHSCHFCQQFVLQADTPHNRIYATRHPHPLSIPIMHHTTIFHLGLCRSWVERDRLDRLELCRAWMDTLFISAPAPKTPRRCRRRSGSFDGGPISLERPIF